MTVQITLVGLDRVGASAGLALASQKGEILRVGHDPSPEVARAAEKLGAVDKVDYNLPSSIEKADVVLLSLPADELRSTLEIIAQDLKEEVVVIDLGGIKAASTSWAKELLPPGRHFLTFTPALNPDYLEETSEGLNAAHADLFKKSITLITCPPNTPADAVKLGEDLCTLLETNVLWSDPFEVDGLSASTHVLPGLVAAALVNATAGQPGWVEARKVAGPAYALATRALDALNEQKQPGRSALLDRENSLRLLDNLISSLNELRSALADQDEESLQKQIETARERRKNWLRERRENSWEGASPYKNVRGSGEILNQFFLGGLFKRKKK